MKPHLPAAGREATVKKKDTLCSRKVNVSKT